MNTQRLQVIRRSLDGLYALVHADIPQLDLTISATAYELTLAAALQVHVGNPLLMLFPDFDHRRGWLLTLIVNANGAVAEACSEDVAFHLVRR